MAEISKELLAKLLTVKTKEEAAALLKAEGMEDAPEDKVWEQVQQLRSQDARELSLDELEDVAGGTRDWLKDGCAATVEYGSDCWGTDGGCAICNISYKNVPNSKCIKCGARCFRTDDGYNYHYNCFAKCGKYKVRKKA